MSGEVNLSDLEQSYPSVSLGSLLSRIESGWSPSCDPVPPATDEWGVLKVSAVSSGRFIESEAKRLPEGMGTRPDLEVRPGDVLLTRANGVRSLVGVACYVSTTRTQLMLSDKTLRVVPKASTDRAFLAMLLSSQGVRRQIGSLLNGGTGQNNISQADVRALRVPDVPLEEQRRIVAVHAAFERRIGVLERLHEKLAAVARASLARELSAGRAHGVVPLKQLLEAVQSGWSPVCDSVPPAPDERGVLRLSAITSGTFVPEEAKRLLSGAVARAALEVVAGDVLVSRANGVKALVGVSCYVEEVRAGLYLPDLVFRLFPDPAHLDPKFLSLVLGSAEMRRQIDSVMRGTSGQYKISKADIRRLSVPAMPLSEQHRIAAVQRGFEHRAGVIKEQITKLQVAQQGAVEALLRGKSCAQAA